MLRLFVTGLYDMRLIHRAGLANHVLDQETCWNSIYSI